jgi:hypothetical protein
MNNLTKSRSLWLVACFSILFGCERNETMIPTVEKQDIKKEVEFNNSPVLMPPNVDVGSQAKESSTQTATTQLKVIVQNSCSLIGLPNVRITNSKWQIVGNSNGFNTFFFLPVNETYKITVMHVKCAKTVSINLGKSPQTIYVKF